MNTAYCNTSRNKKEGVKTAILALILIMMVTLTVIEFTRQEPATWDAEFPMANAKISWLQTHYSGAMPND